MGSDILESIVKEAIGGKKTFFSYINSWVCSYIVVLFTKSLIINGKINLIRRLYTVVDSKPGLTFEAFEIMKRKIAKKYVYCNITIVETCIKRFIESDTLQNVYGQVDKGTNIIYLCTYHELLCSCTVNMIVIDVTNLNNDSKSSMVLMELPLSTK